jgi:parvulin-like peptidyl-prolyl isomerase
MTNKLIFLCSFFVLLHVLVFGEAVGQDNVVKKEEKSVAATVNGAPITKYCLRRTLESIYEMGGSNAVKSMPAASEVLDRLIKRKLVAQEAENIGLDSSPNFEKEMDISRRKILRDLLLEKQVRNIKVTDKEIDPIYRNAIIEYKMQSVFVDNEKDRKDLEDAIKKTKNFEQLVERFVSEKKAKGSKEGQYVKKTALRPEVIDVISKSKIGKISPVVKIGNGYTVFRVTEKRSVENSFLRNQIKSDLMGQKRTKALEAYVGKLKSKYVRINEGLLNRLDFEAKDPGFDRLLKDKRAVAEIRGKKPVTVADLAAEIKKNLYHGVEQAITSKKINTQKQFYLHEILTKNLVLQEAVRQKIEKTEEYNCKYEDERENLLFGLFNGKIVDPELTVKEDEITAYYDENKEKYTKPEMMKLDSILFGKREDAENAIEKLRGGMDYSWAKNNLTGRVAAEAGEEDVAYPAGNVLTVSDLPENIRGAVSGIGAAEYRLAAVESNRFLVIQVQEVYPSSIQPLDEVRGKIEMEVRKQKRVKLVTSWFEKLEKASEIEWNMTRDEVNEIAVRRPQ